MMHPVMRRPPQHTFLAGALRQHRECELEQAVQLVGAMAEIPMVARCHSQHAHQVHRQHQRRILPAKGNKEHPKRRQVQRRKAGDRAESIVTDFLVHSRTRVEMCLRVKSS